MNSPLSVICPTCKARPGEKCVYPGGGVASRTHVQRRHKANLYGSPKGYAQVSQIGAGATPMPGYVCIECGAVVGLPSLHDAWHRKEG